MSSQENQWRQQKGVSLEYQARALESLRWRDICVTEVGGGHAAVPFTRDYDTCHSDLVRAQEHCKWLATVS